MKIKVKYRGKEQVLDINKEKITALDILKSLNLSSEHAFVAVNGELVSEDYIIKENDNIKVINAISGGKQ
ncbi:MoaD/ThiS family protein [Hydrogenothermus marinus]|uniref:Sulfur carrier protein n=1 Tax=Hydrogenothermus marinus TaxID=133270 RepID=A0A3M0BQJ9_9AQUI|nr:MoaD/ThiS family protein [Hydrogenothermus marinus]RMA93182.1 sulfur carrier protein [Hydrogenothermus marinus]